LENKVKPSSFGPKSDEVVEDKDRYKEELQNLYPSLSLGCGRETGDYKTNNSNIVFTKL
jgi:hypothetical protein